MLSLESIIAENKKAEAKNGTESNEWNTTSDWTIGGEFIEHYD